MNIPHIFNLASVILCLLPCNPASIGHRVPPMGRIPGPTIHEQTVNARGPLSFDLPQFLAVRRPRRCQQCHLAPHLSFDSTPSVNFDLRMEPPGGETMPESSSYEMSVRRGSLRDDRAIASRARLQEAASGVQKLAWITPNVSNALAACHEPPLTAQRSKRYRPNGQSVH